MLYLLVSLLADITTLSFWTIKKTFSGISYIIYGPKPKQLTLDDALYKIETQNNEIITLKNNINELTNYVINSNIEVSDDNIENKFVIIDNY